MSKTCPDWNVERHWLLPPSVMDICRDDDGAAAVRILPGVYSPRRIARGCRAAIDDAFAAHLSTTLYPGQTFHRFGARFCSKKAM
jgi:hypothetical protein